MVHDLSSYYQYVAQKGRLPTEKHAPRWSKAVLWTLGLNLDRGTKKNLAKALPEQLAEQLTRAFWLIRFRNTNLKRDEFWKNVAKRGGNTDPDFAHFPTTAVFGGIKQMIDKDLSHQVAKSLAPEVRDLWEQA